MVYKSSSHHAQLARLGCPVKRHPGQVQNVGFYLLHERAQGIHAAGSVAFCCGAGLVAHALSNRTSRGTRSLAQQRKRTAQAMNGQALNSGALQRLGMAGSGGLGRLHGGQASLTPLQLLWQAHAIGDVSGVVVRHLQDLGKQLSELIQKAAAKGGEGVVVGVGACGDAKWSCASQSPTEGGSKWSVLLSVTMKRDILGEGYEFD